MRPKLFLLSLVLLWGCGSGGGSSSAGADAEKRLRIVATTGMIADLAKFVGGERVTVEALMGPGVDPHLYKASPGDISKINRADIVLYNGLHLEGKMGEIFESVGRKKPVLAIAEQLPKDRLLEVARDVPDPHVWFDVSLWSDALEPLAGFLAKADPEGKKLYLENAENYRKQLEQLHQDATELIASIPPERRVLITAHDAFQYFGAAYGIEVRGIQGISTESEAGLREVNALVTLIVERRIPAIFVESSVSEKNVQALVEGARRRGADVRVGGSLFSDAMGAEGTTEGTYVGMIRHNLRQIVEALTR